MDQQAIIADIERRVSSLGISIGRICRQASIHPTTFSRWKKSERNPDPVGASLRSLSALEAALRKMEAARPTEERAA